MDCTWFALLAEGAPRIAACVRILSSRRMRRGGPRRCGAYEMTARVRIRLEDAWPRHRARSTGTTDVLRSVLVEIGEDGGR